jgi:hypothetical protein
MAYYSTDSEEHLVNIGAMQDPNEAAMMDWWFEDPYDYSGEDMDCALNPEVEAHNDEIMAEGSGL